ncbi:MAG: hypothetical protein IPL09_07480 [Bacteroidetes bacterium]|nr:hypothetical protein [Bacteroidota bacterium]
MADLTNISIHDNYEHFVEVLKLTKGVDFVESKTKHQQRRIRHLLLPAGFDKNKQQPAVFLASPKLFSLMNDSSKDLKKELKEIGGKQVNVRKIKMNGKDIEVVKLGVIGEVRDGLTTGDNDYYLFQNPESRGNYKNINDFNEFY